MVLGLVSGEQVQESHHASGQIGIGWPPVGDDDPGVGLLLIQRSAVEDFEVAAVVGQKRASVCIGSGLTEGEGQSDRQGPGFGEYPGQFRFGDPGSNSAHRIPEQA